uniref:Helentron 4 helitron-like transposon replicase/helicase/endonuclease n=1 Tax=Nothobranchius korthausae TaxID=1143690 RepID=A0A1A8FIK2_9TELE
MQTKLSLKGSNVSDQKLFGFENNFDPEVNFYNQNISKSEYYHEEELNKLKIGGFSLIHFNSRSLHTHFSQIKDLLRSLKYKFQIIAISETWLTKETDSCLELEGYNMFNVNRNNKKGGGVAFYVQKHTECKVIDSTVIDGIMKSIIIEIGFTKRKKIILSCMYRTPGSCVETFIQNTADILQRICAKKHVFVCGDFNIDLIKWEEHKLTLDFLNMMFNFGLWPMIDRPSRITKDSATLIDNIFTNICSQTLSGLLINDISDHLPVFAISNMDIFRPLHKEDDESTILVRWKTAERIEAFKAELLNYNWDQVYVDDTNQAYDTFLSIFLEVYNKNCPIRQYKTKKNYKRKPWMTEGLLKACKKKMVLYEKFIKHRTSENEDNYKKYKNKLSTAIRIRRKQYYDEILDKNRNDTRRTWKILNNIIQKRMMTLEWPSYFLNGSNHKVNDPINIVEEFNNFFVSVGPSLANEIAVPPDADTFNNLINSNINSMFLHEISETDVVNTVRKFKNKKSTDINEIDMGIIKEVIFSIVRPLTYVYNLSLQKGHFPKTMKMTKVIPIFKTGNKHSMENYRPIAIIPQFSKILEKLFVNQL